MRIDECKGLRKIRGHTRDKKERERESEKRKKEEEQVNEER